MRVLVTGAGGFIGSWLVRALLERGALLRALVRPTSDLRRLAGLDVELAAGDVTRPESLAEACRGVEVVHHLAAALDAPDEEHFRRVNVDGTRAVLEAATAAGVRRLVFVSSIAAGGASRPGRPRVEDDPPEPRNPYGRSKLAAERLLAERAGGPEIVVVRPPIVHGPGGESMATLYRVVRSGWVPDAAGETQRASFVDARDLAEGIALAGERAEAAGRCFHLCGPEDLSMVAYQRAVAEQLGRRVRVLRVPAPALRLAAAGADAFKRVSGARLPFGRDRVAEALAPGWQVSDARARQLLGYAPRHALADTIRDAIADYRARGSL